MAIQKHDHRIPVQPSEMSRSNSFIAFLVVTTAFGSRLGREDRANRTKRFKGGRKRKRQTTPCLLLRRYNTRFRYCSLLARPRSLSIGNQCWRTALASIEWTSRKRQTRPVTNRHLIATSVLAVSQSAGICGIPLTRRANAGIATLTQRAHWSGAHSAYRRRQR